MEYRDFVEVGKQLCRELLEEGADVLIALTHMRLPNDELLAMECPDLDLILAGHDHVYDVREVCVKMYGISLRIIMS